MLDPQIGAGIREITFRLSQYVITIRQRYGQAVRQTDGRTDDILTAVLRYACTCFAR